MRFLGILFVYMCFSGLVFGQTKPKGHDVEVFIGYYNKKECKKKLKRTLHINDTCFYKSTGDALILSFKDSVQTRLIKLNFGQTEDQLPVDYCTSQEMQSDCNECAMKYLNKILHTKSYGWRKTEENKYVAAYNFHVQLEVTIQDKEHYGVNLLFTYIDKPSKEFKTWYYTLSKPE